MHTSLLLHSLLVLVVWLLPTPISAQGEATFNSGLISALIDEIGQRAASGDCKYLDNFTDRNIRNRGAAGVAARFYALDSLVQSAAGEGRASPCQYHDRKMSLRVSIELYGASAQGGTHVQATLAEAWLQVALGRSWRETLANAGVIAAAQDLAALHLSCFRKDGQRSTKFWDWFIGDPAAVPRFELFDYDLEVYARSVPCENMVGQANPELACYWNAVEGKLVSGPEDTVISFEMWQLLNKLTLLPRGEALLMSMVKFAEQKGWSLDDLRVVGFAQSELRKLIAEGCAKILSATVREELRKRAARVPSTSVESVIASFK